MKTYNIIVLGSSGSGKTLFLASMFKKLSVQNKEIGFFLETDPDKRKKLLTKFREFAHPGLDWPPGTLRNEVSRWIFTCAIKSPPGAIYPILRFAYLDYSGEVITEVLEDLADGVPTWEIEQEVKKADALLVLLDGQKILYLMQDKAQAFDKLEHDLNNILPIVNRVSAMPIHFVITKWDLLQQEKYSLGEVRNCLFEFGYFKDIVDQRRTLDMPTRLIPTSALGHGFAQIDCSGMMKKNKNRRPEPFQVEMPLACILIDKYQVIKNQLDSDQISVGTLLLSLGVQLLSLFSTITRYLPVSGPPVFWILFELLGRGIERSEYIIKQKQTVSLEAIRNRRTAIECVLTSFNRLIWKLEDRFPDSNLQKFKLY